MSIRGSSEESLSPRPAAVFLGLRACHNPNPTIREQGLCQEVSMAVRIRSLSYFVSMGMAVAIPWVGIIALVKALN